MNNAKGDLQVWLQKKGLRTPTYHVKSSGPPNCPTHVCTVTVRFHGGDSRSECVEKRGGKKKDAEQLAARKMIQRLQQSTAGYTSSGATPRMNGSVSSASRSVSPEVNTSRGRSPSLADINPVSRLQQYFQGTGTSLPQYIEDDHSSTASFRTRCVLSINGRHQLETLGDGRNKKISKEDAARKMLKKIQTTHNPLDRGTSNAPGVVDETLDDDITANLCQYSPQFHFWYGPGQMVFCLASVMMGKATYPITGHGMGDMDSIAKREALCNLASSIATLQQSH